LSLCLRLGYPHPDYLTPYLSASQLTDWIAFNKLHNLHYNRDDAFWTQHLAMYYAAHLPKGESAKTPDEFVPWYDKWDEPWDAQTARQKLGF
jgi:hypothetical protein